MLKKRSSVCMKQVLIPPYCRMCVAAAREESFMCFPSPSSRTVEQLANHGYCSDIKIILSYLLLQKLVCLVSSVPRYRPSLLVPSLFLLLFFVFLSILWGVFVPSPCKQCCDEAGYPRFWDGLRWGSFAAVAYIFVCTASFLWIWLSPPSSAATADSSATLGAVRLALGFIYLLSDWFMFIFSPS